MTETSRCKVTSIDVGWSTGPVSCQELADTIAAETKRTLKTMIVPWWGCGLALARWESSTKAHAIWSNMFAFFRTGKYVADNKLHEELLGPVPAKNDAVKRWAPGSKALFVCRDVSCRSAGSRRACRGAPRRVSVSSASSRAVFYWMIVRRGTSTVPRLSGAMMLILRLPRCV